VRCPEVVEIYADYSKALYSSESSRRKQSETAPRWETATERRLPARALLCAGAAQVAASLANQITSRPYTY